MRGLPSCLVPPWVAYQVGRRLAARLVDRNKVQVLEDLAVAAGKLERLQLAVVSVAAQAGIPLSSAAVRRTIRMLKKHRAALALHANRRTRESPLPIAWVLSLGVRHGLIEAAPAREILAMYLPGTLGHDAGSQFDRGGATEALLFAFTVDSALRNEELDVKSIAPPGVKKDREKAAWRRTREIADFDSNVVPLACWARLYVDSVTEGSIDKSVLLSRYDTLAGSDFKTYGDYETPRLLINGTARAAIRILSQLPASTEQRNAFAQWLTDNFRHLNWPTIVDVVRVSSPVAELHQLGLELASRLRDAVHASALPAEDRYETLLSLARATYAFDPEESRTDFDGALEITTRLGGNVYDRWSALGRLAKHASDAEDQPAQAYRLAQVAEGLQFYLGGESHITVGVLAAIQQLSGTTGLAVASRWRDRRVAHIDELVRVLTSGDAAPIGIHPLWALGMLPVGAGPSRVHLNELGQSGNPVRDDAEAVINEWLRPFGTGEPEDAAADAGGAASTSPTPPPDLETSTATGLFDNFDLATPADWDAAIRLADDDEHGGTRRSLLLDHATNLPPVKLRPMLEAAADSSLLTLHDYGRLVELLAARNQGLPEAARKALAKLVDRLVDRFTKQLTTRGYDALDFEAIESACGRTRFSVESEALRHLGAVPELLTSSECYELVVRLTGRAKAAENATILGDALESFSQVAPHDSGDGPFEQLPVPPADLESCVAAFVWCAAGDPAKATRWNVAHTIRLWLALGCTDLIDALVRWVNGETDVAPFIDSRLVFYDRHALMWTLMAIARACDDDQALTNVAQVAPLIPLLRRIVFTDPPHAVLNHSARDVLMRLHEVGALTLEPEEIGQLTAINRPTVTVEEQWGSRPESMTAQLDAPHSDSPSQEGAEEPQPQGWSKADTRFSFLMDFEDHWCDRLGRAFGVADRRILELVDEVIVDRWGSPFMGRADDDRRHELKLYGSDGTYVHKSSWPAEDDLDFYLSLHALYEVAGHLARHRSAFQSQGSNQDDFAEWLDDHTPTRSDGRWIFDRRDPVPRGIANADSSARTSARGPNRSDWLFDISAPRFDQILRPSNGWVTADGHWTETLWDRYEVVDVDSALVDATTARALVVALQTAPNLHHVSLPPESDHHVAADPDDRYRLIDLVENRHSGEGIDVQDPNASGIHWPPPRPTDRVVTALGLSPDRDLREWADEHGAQIATSVWSTGSESGSAGHRLQFRDSAMTRLLASEQRALVVSVSIRRYLDSRYGDEDDVTKSIQPYVKFFLLRSDGAQLEFVN